MSKKHKAYIPKGNDTQQQLEEKAGAYEFLAKINFILARIRVSNEGMMNTDKKDPKEGDPKKIAVQKVFFPDEGGVLVEYEDTLYPSKGFMYGDSVEIVDEVKKTGMAFLRGFFGGMEKSKLRMLLFVLLFRNQFKNILFDLLAEMDYRISRILQKPERYCISGRELYRVFDLMAFWKPEWKVDIEHLRNIICMVWEYDDAYRYPGQDVMAEMDKDAIRKDVVAELGRLIDIYVSRDERGTAQKFKRIKKLLFLLKFTPKLKESLKRFFLELKVERLILDDADYYHAKYKEGYDWNHAGRDKKEEQKENVSEQNVDEYQRSTKLAEKS